MGNVTVDGSGLRLGADLLPVFSAEAHSWRIDPNDWPRVLDAIADLGFTCVSTYLPWSRHERAPGDIALDGRFDVVRFWSLAAERGLYVIARPGPNAGAELEDSGWPRRILDDPHCQARRPDGRPYLLPTATHHGFMPSYGSHATLAAVGQWYDAIAPVIARSQWPDGPVIAVQVDNEMGFHFQSHPFALDYHPDTVAQWHEWSGQTADPPRDGREGTLEARVAWVEFREHHLRRSLGTLAGMLRERGVDAVPLIHNDYPRTTTPFDTRALEAEGIVDVAAGDMYATRQGGRHVRDYARHLAGSSKLPWLAEAGVGWITLPWLLPMAVDPADAEHNLWRALSGGIRAFNVFMAVERDRWYGAPISVTGEVREPQASAYRRVLRTLRELRWHTLRREPQALLVENRDESRRAAAHAQRGDLVPPFMQSLPLDLRLFEGTTEASDRIGRWEREWRTRLDSAGVDWDSVSSSSLSSLTGYELVVVASRATLGERAGELLAKAEADGVRVVSDDVDIASVPLSFGTPSKHDGIDITRFRAEDGSVLELHINGSDDEADGIAPWGAQVREASA